MDATNVNGVDKLIIRYLLPCFCLVAVACINKSKCSEEEKYVISSVPANISILSIDTADKSCHTDVINFAVREAVEKTSIAHGFTISNSVVACGPEKCGPNEVQETVFRELVQAPSELAIIGPACSSTANAIAQISHLFQIPVVSLAPLPSENKYLFSLLPAYNTLMDGIIRFVEAYPEWQRVEIISQDHEMFRIAATYLEQIFRDKNISVENSIVIPRNFQLPKPNIDPDLLFGQSVRIIILNMDSSLIRATLCKAAVSIHHQYVWITPGFHDSWWLEASDIHCSDSDLHSFLHKQGVLVISNVLSRSGLTNCRSDGNATQHQGKFWYPLNSTMADLLTSLTYDAVLSIALGLNSTILTNQYNLVNHEVIRTVGETLASTIGDVNFHGQTSNICFKNNEISTTGLQIFQFRQESDENTELTEVGVVFFKQGVEFTEGESRDSLWENGVPSDGSPVSEVKYPERVLALVVYVFAGCNILAAIGGMLFMIVFRKRRLIRLSSPNLNYLVGIGIIIFNSSVFLFAYPPSPVSAIDVVCGIRSWAIAIGYSLCLGTINTKMWRVYYIFRSSKLTSRKVPLKDWHLLLFVALFLIIDVVLLSFATSFTNSRLQAVVTSDVEHEDDGVNEEGFEVEYKVVLCDSKNKFYWIPFLFGYKILLHVIAVILAFKIRRVKVKVLNDSKEVVLILYLTGLVLAAVIIITFAFPNYLNVYTGAYAVGVCTTSAVILGVVFISKAIQLYKDPDGTDIFPPANNNSAANALETCDDMREMAKLQKKVRTLEAKLSFYNKPIDAVDSHEDIAEHHSPQNVMTGNLQPIFYSTPEISSVCERSTIKMQI